MLNDEGPASGQCISELTFDQWHSGELPPACEAPLRAHLAACVACAARRGHMLEQAEAYLARPESTATFERLFAQRATSRAGSGRWLAVLGVAAVAALALVSWLPRPEPFATRSKGGMQVGFFVKRAQGVVRGAPEELLHPGDRLRFTLRSDRAGYPAILALDQQGTVSVYYPSDEEQPVLPVDATSDEVVLDAATELDAVVGRETIYALLCERPLPITQLRRTLARKGSLSAPKGCLLDVLRIHKEALPP